MRKYHFTPVGLAIIIIIQAILNWTLISKILNLEARITGVEMFLEETSRQTTAVRMCIKETNPALVDDQVATITAAIIISARSNGLDPLLLTSVARIESSFDPVAVSRAGARGLLQVRPATFREVHTGNIDNWQDNIEAGARYLRGLLRRFGDLRLALAAYNCGPSRSRKRILEISGEYADLVISGWNRLRNSGGDNVDGVRPLYLASSRW